MSITIPDGLPTLARGCHKPGEGLACAMEYVSVLAGERFSDAPACTHDHLAAWTRGVNDAIDDDHRYLLLPVICRLVGANRVYCGTGCADIVSRELIFWQQDHPEPNPRTTPAQAVAWLNAAIDEYDRLVGRTAEPTITLADVQAVGVAIRKHAVV